MKIVKKVIYVINKIVSLKSICISFYFTLSLLKQHFTPVTRAAIKQQYIPYKHLQSM